MKGKSKLSKCLLGFTLLAAATGGMPMTPEEIEELLHAHNQDEVVDVLETDEPYEADRLLEELGLNIPKSRE